jgi:hypothetical protein
VAFAPDNVPGLTLPNSPEATRAMDSMDMHESPSGSMSEQEMPAHDEMNGAKSGMPAP